MSRLHPRLPGPRTLSLSAAAAAAATTTLATQTQPKDRRWKIRARESPGRPHAPETVDPKDHRIRGSARGWTGRAGMAGGNAECAEAVDRPERRNKVQEGGGGVCKDVARCDN